VNCPVELQAVTNLQCHPWIDASEHSGTEQRHLLQWMSQSGVFINHIFLVWTISCFLDGL
jgi:hypothetical protein